MSNKYGLKVGDKVKSKLYGEAIILELLPKAKARLRFINSGTEVVYSLYKAINGKICDHIVREIKSNARKQKKLESSDKHKSQFLDFVQKVWSNWNSDSGINGAKYVPVLGSSKRGGNVDIVKGKTLVDSWFYEKYYGIALVMASAGYAQISKNKHNIEKFFGIKLGKGDRIKKPLLLHHFIKAHTNFSNYVIDHINGDPSDNRFENLRTCTTSENVRNSIKTTKEKCSKYKGVFYDKNRDKPRKNKRPPKCWRARADVGKNSYTTWHASEIEAAKGYDVLAKLHFGEFAKLNF